MPFDRYDKKFRHLVYYYELPETFGEVVVSVRMNPVLVDDDMFYGFVDDSKPTFVGAFHRHELREND